LGCSPGLGRKDYRVQKECQTAIARAVHAPRPGEVPKQMLFNNLLGGGSQKMGGKGGNELTTSREIKLGIVRKRRGHKGEELMELYKSEKKGKKRRKKRSHKGPTKIEKNKNGCNQKENNSTRVKEKMSGDKGSSTLGKIKAQTRGPKALQGVGGT